MDLAAEVSKDLAIDFAEAKYRLLMADFEKLVDFAADCVAVIYDQQGAETAMRFIRRAETLGVELPVGHIKRLEERAQECEYLGEPR